MTMKMGFVQRDEHKNAVGVHIYFDATATVQDVHRIRRWYRENGWQETRTTKKLTDAQALEACREQAFNLPHPAAAVGTFLKGEQ